MQLILPMNGKMLDIPLIQAIPTLLADHHTIRAVAGVVEVAAVAAAAVAIVKVVAKQDSDHQRIVIKVTYYN